MSIVRALGAAALLLVSLTPMVNADTGTPVATAPPVVVSTSVPATVPPPLATAVPATESPPVVPPTQPPIKVSQERSTPVTSITQPVVPEATTGSGASSVPPSPGPGVAETGPNHPGSSSTPSPRNAPTQPAAVATAASNPISASPGATAIAPPPVQTGVGVTVIPTSAQAPAQLQCTGKSYPDSGPFLSSPYAGWTELFSYVDHDSPDYSVDGRIVIANGLTATSADGQASDYFPAYWAPSIRQYLNYDGHNGYDFGITYQPVLAAGDGTVMYAGWNDPDPYAGYGQMVLINHHNGYVTLYGHLDKLEVKTGDRVIAGQEIGISGSTGRSSGPHLHFSVFHNCHVTDPYGWTGSGRDPLRDFDGEHAQYLWLPGHDPLILNPPPNWPAYPVGLKVTLPPGQRIRRGTPSTIPPTDRLLLLALPGPGTPATVAPEVALARTQARITAEAEALLPQLSALRSEGLIDSYQVIPSAAAIWVHGTATAQQLEGLDGVASLSGAEPHDMLAAQLGLAHAALIQMDQQQAPSLWPAGFRTGLHSWRPLVTVMMGTPLVAGVALAGSQVHVALYQGASVVATASTTADVQSGGFVVTLQSLLGAVASTRAGETVVVTAQGRTARISLRRLTLNARRNGLSGVAPVGSTLALASLPPTGTQESSVLPLGARSDFHLSFPASMPAGTVAVAGAADAAGNRIAAAAYVPGIEAMEGGSSIHGWVVGDSPRLRVLRAGRVVFAARIHPASDGTFQEEVHRGNTPLLLAAGDTVVVGSARHSRSIHLPGLSLEMAASSDRVRLSGPPHAHLDLQLTSDSGGTASRMISLSSSGQDVFRAPGGTSSIGDSGMLTYLLPSGDAVTVATEASGIVVRSGAGQIDGHARPDQIVDIRAFDASNHLDGHDTTSTDAAGQFSAVLRAPGGGQANIRGARTVIVTQGHSVLSFSLPELAVSVRQARFIRVSSAANVPLLFTLGKGKTVQSMRARTDATGTYQLDLRRLPTGGVRRVVVAWVGASGASVQRVFDLPRPAVTAVHSACRLKRAHGAHAACPSRLARRIG